VVSAPSGTIAIKSAEEPVAVTQEDDEVGAGRDPLASGELLQTDPKRSLVQPRLFIDPPAQVDRLEAEAML
jgi:hypothetical protein